MNTEIKTTTSVCATCLQRVPARVFDRDGRTFLAKRCPSHGDEEVLLASDSSLYWNRSPRNPCGSQGCCLTNHSCTLIFEITERCNLTCPTCFAGSSPQHTWQMSFTEFCEKLDTLISGEKQNADMIQLSGGEPSIHPDLERMVAYSLEQGVSRVYINTNGIRLATDPEFVKRIATIDGGRDRVQFYLQFDGFDERTHDQLRGAKGLGRIKEDAIVNILDAGLFVLPVMTVTRGVNLGQVGKVINMMLEHHPGMNTVMLQPAFYAGRHDTRKTEERLTLAELVHAVQQQTSGMFGIEDFGPIPCSDPNCFAMAVGLVRNGSVIPVSRYFPRFDSWEQPDIARFVDRFADRLPHTMLEDMASDDTIDALLDLLTQGDDDIDWSDYRNFAVIGIKPFMDAHTYDQDRVDGCCVHIVDREGKPVSLCEYNAVRRPLGQL